MGFKTKGLKWVLKREVGARVGGETSLEKIKVLEEERGGVLRI